MKWVTMWANAQSIVMPKEATYAKDLTLRYPVYVPFSGNKARITIDNFVIGEEIHLDSVTLAKADGLTDKIISKPVYLTFRGKKIHPFCTHEGSGLSSTERDIQKTAKGALVTKGLAICGSDVDVSMSKVEAWAK